MAKQHSHLCPECGHEWFHENPSVYVTTARFNAMHNCPACGFGPVTDKYQCDCGQTHEPAVKRCPGTSAIMAPVAFIILDSQLDRMIDDMMDQYLEI